MHILPSLLFFYEPELFRERRSDFKKTLQSLDKHDGYIYTRLHVLLYRISRLRSIIISFFFFYQIPILIIPIFIVSIKCIYLSLLIWDVKIGKSTNRARVNVRVRVCVHKCVCLSNLCLV